MSDEKRVGRRRFFRAALGELIKPLEKKADPVRRALQQINGFASQQPPAPAVRPPPGRTASRGADPFGPSSYAPHAPASPAPRRNPALPVLRPPGAQPEDLFRQLCTQCGECVQVCPARCIKIEPGGRGDGFPFIAVDEMPCVLCDGLLCMDRCPTNALVSTAVADIDMGTAEWHEASCVRTRHEECTTCLDQCPLGSAAIELRDGKIHVLDEGCTGCGVCEHFCPTTPKSITVTPQVVRDS